MNSTTGSKYLTPCRSLGLSKVLKKTPSSGGLAMVAAKSINSPFSSPLISDDARTVPLVKKKQSAVHSTLWSTPLISKSRFKMGLSKSAGKHSLGKAKDILQKPASLKPKTLLGPESRSSDSKDLMSCGIPAESSEQRNEEDCVVPQLESYSPENSSVIPKCESPELKDLLVKTPKNESLEEPDLFCSISVTESHHTDVSPEVLVKNYSSHGGPDAPENNEFFGWDPINDAEEHTKSQSKMNILKTYIQNIDNNSSNVSQELETSDHQVRFPDIEKDLVCSEGIGLSNAREVYTDLSGDTAATIGHNESNVAMGSLQNGDVAPIAEKPNLSESSPSTVDSVDISHSMSFTDECETPQGIANSTMEVSQQETKSSSVEQWTFKTPLPRDFKTYDGKTSKRGISSSKKSALNRTKQRVLDRLGLQTYRGTVSITNEETKVHHFLAARKTVNPSFLESFSEDEDVELKNDIRKWLKGGRRVIDEIIEMVRLQKDRNMTVMEVLQEQGVDPNLVGFDPDREEFISFEKFLLKNNIA